MKAYRTAKGHTPVVSFRVEFLVSERELIGCLAAHFQGKSRAELPQLTLREATKCIREELWHAGMTDNSTWPGYVQTWAHEQVRRLFGPMLDSV